MPAMFPNVDRGLRQSMMPQPGSGGERTEPKGICPATADLQQLLAERLPTVTMCCDRLGELTQRQSSRCKGAGDGQKIYRSVRMRRRDIRVRYQAHLRCGLSLP